MSEIQIGSIYYMLRGYFDGSGKVEDSEYITLTGVFASESVWERFERSWGDVLKKHQISDFHMSEAMSLSGRFSRENGWDRKKLDELVKDLWNVIGQYRWTKDLSLGSNLHARSCTVVVADYHRARAEIPNIREAEALCTGYCVHRFPFDLDSELEYPEIVLLFDRKEPFLKTVNRGWVKYKKRTDAGWPKQIKDIVSVSAAKLCPMQAADLIAWTINKHHKTASGYPDAFGAFLMVSHDAVTFDYETIMKTPRELICF